MSNEPLMSTIIQKKDMQSYRHTYIDMYTSAGMIKETMNRTTNLFVFLIVISFIFPATAIRYAQAAGTTSESLDNNATSAANMTENNTNMTGESMENNATSPSAVDEAPPANMTENNANMTGESMENNATSAGVPENATSPYGSMKNAASGMESNNSANARQESSSTENATSTGVPENATSPSGSTVNNGTGTTPVTNGTGNETANFVDTILGIHNRERAAVNASGSVPALVWSDKLAADAKTYAEHLIATGEFTHPSAEWVAAHPTGPEGENLAGRSPQNPNELAQMAEGWVAEKKVLSERGGEPGDFNGVGHYTQMVWNTTKAVGCATASGGGRDILDCRYSPPGNIIGQKPY
ncbi:MAG: CAP domain-containing protein [Candidatus Nitrosopolaris sp.]